MAADNGTPKWMTSVRAFLDIARDAVLLLVVLLLLLMPRTIDGILSRAGFTRASILGFDWEKKLDEAAQQTEAAQKQVEELNGQLGTYAKEIEKIAPAVADSAAKKDVASIAARIRVSKKTAESVGAHLRSNAASQSNLKRELAIRIRPPEK